MHEIFSILATFTQPEYISTSPVQLLWMFPLLAAISIIYKITKMKVIFWRKFAKEVVILFLTTSILMILAGLALGIIVQIATG